MNRREEHERYIRTEVTQRTLDMLYQRQLAELEAKAKAAVERAAQERLVAEQREREREAARAAADARRMATEIAQLDARRQAVAIEELRQTASAFGVSPQALLNDVASINLLAAQSVSARAIARRLGILRPGLGDLGRIGNPPGRAPAPGGGPRRQVPNLVDLNGPDAEAFLAKLQGLANEARDSLFEGLDDAGKMKVLAKFQSGQEMWMEYGRQINFKFLKRVQELKNAGEIPQNVLVAASFRKLAENAFAVIETDLDDNFGEIFHRGDLRPDITIVKPGVVMGSLISRDDIIDIIDLKTSPRGLIKPAERIDSYQRYLDFFGKPTRILYAKLRQFIAENGTRFTYACIFMQLVGGSPFDVSSALEATAKSPNFGFAVNALKDGNADAFRRFGDAWALDVGVALRNPAMVANIERLVRTAHARMRALR